MGRTEQAARVAAVLALAATLTCGGPGEPPPGGLGELRGVVYYGGPLAGATVTVRQYYLNEETVLIGTTTTGEDGAYVVPLTRPFLGDFLVTVEGGTYVEAAGGTVTLDASAVLRAPVQDFQPGEHRDHVVVTPLSELVWQLGRARLAIREDADYAAAVAHARSLVAAHVGFDPLATAIAPTSESTPLNEPAKHALVLAGMSELAAIAATDRGVSVQAINTRVLVSQLVRDASSTEARLDGNGASEVLCLAPTCPLPTGCTAEGPGCYTPASVYSNTLRARLGAAVLVWLQRPANGTGLGRTDVLPWVTHLKDSNDPMLFGGDPPEALDATGPVVTWVAPTENAPVTGTVALELTASDELGIASITVETGTEPPVAVTDTDPAAERFAATFSTAGLEEGPFVFTATARNVEGLATTLPRTISVNNVPGGVLEGIVVKGPVAGATVRAVRFEDGVPGTQLGQGTTGADGRFGPINLTEGYSGPVLIVAGEGGSYSEEAAPATVVLDVSDRLRTVIPAYQDGAALTSIVVSPLTSFAVTYFEYLRDADQTGATVADLWGTAHSGIEAHFGVNNIRTTVPPSLATVTSTNSVTNYALVLLGLSELAYRASNAGGGDGGNFGTSMSALRVVRVLEQDLADGCWDGLDEGTPLVFGGTQSVGVRATRLDLANALVANELSATRDATPGISDVADLIGLLDNLSRGGGNTAPGSCAGNRLHPDAGASFDQQPPTIAWLTAPTDGATVRQSLIIEAFADDVFDPAPDLVMELPSGTLDANGADDTLRTTIDTTTRPDGPLEVRLRATDASSRSIAESRLYTVDNTPPTVSFTGGLVDGNWYAAPVAVSFTVSEAAATTVTVDGAPSSLGAMITAEGQHVLRVTATDAAGNVTTRMLTLYLDLTPPTVSVTGPTGTWIRQAATFTAIADDTMKVHGSLSTDVTVTAVGPTGAAAIPTTVTPTTLADGRRQLVATFDTAALTASVGDGTLTVRFAVTDRVAHTTTSPPEVRTIDNTPPSLTLAAVRNQSGVQLDGLVNEAAATIRGSLTAPGGSPVTVTVTATPGGGTGMVVPDVAGAFSYTTSALAEGTISVAATAVDAAGNTATAAPVSFIVDRTGPSVTFQTSAVLDERSRCTATVNVSDYSTGAISIPGTPATYTCLGAPTDLAPGGATLSKYVGRLDSLLTNPILWNVATSDVGGAGIASAPSTVRFRVYRLTPGAWRDATPGTLTGSTLNAAAAVLSSDWPELVTHTATFTLEVQAQDRLGNFGPSVTRTWNHVPLGNPVGVQFAGNATSTVDMDGMFALSLHRYSLFPSGAQLGPAAAMSNGFSANAPRALFVFNVVNPHPTPQNVGFFLPAISGATYTRRVWDTSPWIASSSMTAPTIGTCPAQNPWPSPAWSARINHSAPYNCNTSSCTCNGSGWNEPADALAPSSTTPLPDNTLVVRAFVRNPLSGDFEDQLPVLGLTSTVNGRPFFEFQLPPASSSAGVVVKVLVALPNLDFFAPWVDGLDGVQESDGLGSEVHTTTGGYTPTMTASFYERWGDCAFTSGSNCTGVRPRRHLRALVEARISIPFNGMQLNVRERASNAATASPEVLPHLGDDLDPRRNTVPFLWETCEAPGYTPYSGQLCAPSVPTTTNSAL